MVILLALISIHQMIQEAKSLSEILGGVTASVVMAFAFALPVSVRRLHDMDKSGWWWALALIPIIGTIILIIWCGFIKGTAGTNRYG